MDYLDKPPQRYDHVFQKNSGSREMVEDDKGEYVKFDDMDLYMFEGAQLMQQALAEHKAIAAELETERMRLAGCGVAALADTPESMASQRLSIDSPFWSASYGDVLRRVQECIDLRARIAHLEAALNRSADTFADMEKTFRVLGRPLIADACKIAYEDARLTATVPSTLETASESFARLQREQGIRAGAADNEVAK